MMLTRLLLLLVFTSVALAGEARWMRFPAISPDGKSIVFSYRGDLWRVPAAGGAARPITTHVGYERSPVWSPDGKWIAFASDRHGNFDIFLAAAGGGDERRLTHHSNGDIPFTFSEDGKRVFFSGRRQDTPESNLGTPWAEELYSIGVAGGRPKMELTTPAYAVRVRGSKILYQDFKGWEQYYRKHHVSPVARDIAIYDKNTKTHRRLTRWGGEDREPVWAGDDIYFCSERSGNFNVWKMGEPPVQVTNHGPHPVRFLSAASDGTLCYGYNGEIWTKALSGEPAQVKVTVGIGARNNDVAARTLSRGATGFAVAPNEKEVAFVVRGEVFVASVKHGTTKRVTNTAGQERSVTWGKDGRTLYYASERGGSWNLYQTSLVRKEEKFFFQATTLKEEPVLVTADDTFQPLASPDGKQLAYLKNRDEVRVMDLATKQSRRLVAPERNYSYSDGDINLAWSPDSAWIASTYLPVKSYIENIALVNVASGALHNVTLSGYYEWSPVWSANGKMLLYGSTRRGRRSHGSWGADSDVFAIYLTRAAFDEAQLTTEEFELRKDEQDDKKKEDKEKAKPDGKKEKEKKDEEKKPDPVKFELAGHEERLKRLTLHSVPLGGFAISPDGDTLVYFGRVNGVWDLWKHSVRKAETKRLAEFGDSGEGEVVFAKDGDAVFLLRSTGAIARVSVDGGKTKPVKYAADMTIDGPRERRYIFDHVWRQTRGKFYDPKLHGVDWAAVGKNYGGFLDHIDNNHDFANLLSEMVGELNASHTGSRYRIPQDGADATASLGLLFDPRHEGAGLKVAEVLEGGPLDKAGDVKLGGAILTHIDGVALAENVNVSAQLNRKAGKRVLLAFSVGGKAVERVVKPVPLRAEFGMFYKRWVKRGRATTEELSNGRLGYVHVRGMNDASFRVLFKEALGRFAAKEGLIVDTRFNGGGWLHDDLVKFLSGERYITFQPRGKERGSVGGEPQHRWARPSVVLQSESNYSDAHMFPYAFQQLKMGKLIGTPVAGTGTAVWWERQIDRSLSYGIPQVGMVMPSGKYLENSTLQPDVLVYNDDASKARGEDKQLAKAVEVLLAQLK